MNTTPAPDNVLEVLARVFPITQDLVSLELCLYDGEGAVLIDKESLRIILRLIIWDEADGVRMIRDIKEQQVLVCHQRIHEFPERLEAGLQAHAEVLKVLFQDPPEEMSTYMPTDLLFPKVFALKSAQTVEDFIRALSVRSRLDIPTLRDDGPLPNSG